MWSKWYLIKTNKKSVIRRYRRGEDGKVKWERLPASQYANLSEGQLEALLTRLNTTYQIEADRALDRYKFDHAYINSESLDRFDSLVRSAATSKAHIRNANHHLRKYVLEFFIHERKLPDPRFWVDVESEWGLWLIDKVGSYHTIKAIIYVGNRFLHMLSRQMYKDLRLVKLEPIGRKRLAKLKQDTSSKRFKFISEERFKRIYLDAPANLKAPIFLCYNFGLRISESLAITQDCLYEEFLKVEEQGEKFTNGKMLTKTPKNYQERKVPYWYATPDQVYEIVSKIKHMHPDTLIRKMNMFLKKYGHESHDMRRSFITRALKIDKRDLLAVKDAAGHAEVDTTLGYLQSTGEQAKKWTPKKVG